VDSLRRETVKTPAGTFKTVRYEAYLLNNVIYRRSGRVYIWLTDDRRRCPFRSRCACNWPLAPLPCNWRRKEMIRRIFACYSGGCRLSQQPNACSRQGRYCAFQTIAAMIESTAAASQACRALRPGYGERPQAQMNLDAGTIGAATLTYDLLVNVRAYLALAESVPKPYRSRGREEAIRRAAR